MLEPIYTKRFRKQFKLAEKRGRNIAKLRKVMNLIVNEQPLPPECNNHPLHGEWKGSLECHIQGDFISALR